MEGVGVSDDFWRDKKTLVTGANGFLGGWLVGRLLDRKADVVCLIRDWVPQSELVRGGQSARTTVVAGDVRDQPRQVVGALQVQLECRG